MPKIARSSILSSVCAMSTGAALMYFFDPDRGARRRALARDKAQSLTKDSGDWLRKAGRDLGNRTRGIAAEARSHLATHPPSDEVLAERVRSRMGRYVTHPGAIDVAAAGGFVTLRGDILQAEMSELLSSIRSIRGVSDVHNQLTTHSDAAGIPGLQGHGSTQKPGLFPKRSPARRMILAATGGALAVYGTTTRSRLGRSLGAFGFGLLTSQLSNRPLRRVFHLPGNGRSEVTF